MFLSKTIQNILENIEGDTEVICVLDGAWADPPVADDPRVTLVYHNQSIGQRAATNEACKLSKAKFVMKVDAHCAFDKGFDVKLMADMQDDWTVAPLMRNLHAFDWVCKKCGDRRYQGPTPTSCPKCDNKTEFERDVMWVAKPSPQSTSYCFDIEPHFQYFGEFKKRPEGQGDITESMSLQGSCFMVTRDKYWELNLCDESMGSWGSQGIEVACKTWLSGGRVMINHKTWYAHMFRTQGGDFGFPYPLGGNQVSSAKKKAKDLFFNNKWDKAIHPLSWLVEKFWPVPKWTQADLDKLKGISTPTKGIIFYTDNQLNLHIAHKVQKQLKKIGLPIISSSLKPMNFGKNIVIHEKRGYLTLAKQILAALEASEANIIFFCEHDVLYHPSHFNFTPPSNSLFYYNQNVWRLRSTDGFAVHYDCNQLSGLCCYRDLAIQYYKDIVKKIEKEGFSMKTISFEPGTRDNRWVAWKSEQPNVDIRHGANLTKSKWSPKDFRNPKYCINWESAYEIPFWGKIKLTLK
jgi:hypothetical protein